MAKFLHEKYPDYGRKKFREFKGNVERGYDSLLTSQVGNVRAEPIEIDSSSESETEKEAIKVKKSMNDTIVSLYSPKTDFEKYKEAAKEAEKSLKNPKKPLDGQNGVTKAKVKDPSQNVNRKAPEEDVQIIEKPVEMIDIEVNSRKSSRASSPTPQKSAKKKRVELTAFKESKVDFSDVAGMETTLLALGKLMIRLKAKPECKKRTVLLHGPPGCGKTLLANAIAGQFKLPLLEVLATEIVAGVTGESESKLRSIFEQAATAGEPVVLFMDEIEAIAQKKDSGSASRGMDNRIITQFR